MLDQTILKRKFLGNDWNSNQYNVKEIDIEVDGPFWTDLPT
jgi:hypothetical protein